MGNNDLMHYGVLGMRWGIRRYQNKDGSLTDIGKKKMQAYETSRNLKNNLNKEGNALIKSNKKLSKDFGGKYENVDDDAFFEYVARTYGLNTEKFWDAKTTYSKFYNENKKSIKKGQIIVDKLLNE